MARFRRSSSFMAIRSHQAPGLRSMRGRAGLGLMVQRGYVAAALSQPGYGNSGGPPDFCGPVASRKLQRFLCGYTNFIYGIGQVW